MPSKKAAARQRQHVRKPVASTLGALNSSTGTTIPGMIERDPRQIVAIETPASSPKEEQGIEVSMAESSSQESLQNDASTEEGSCSSGCNSIIASHDGWAEEEEDGWATSPRTSQDCIKLDDSSLSRCNSITASHNQASSLRASESIDTCDFSDTLPRPIWVDNGDATAWLLVMPKAPCKIDMGNADALSIAPKDAILLGPYVAMKNTFLDEIGIAERLRGRQLFRARSIGACRCGLP